MTTSFLFSQNSSSQKQTRDTTKTSLDKYWHFLSHPNEKSQNYLLTGNLQLMVSPYGNILGANGIVGNGGFNLARFFSRKFILGFCFDVKIKGWIPPTKPSKEFINDFNTGFISQNNSQDSANAFVVQNAINTGAFEGSTYGNIGVMFSLFPQKYGGILIQIKKGSRAYAINSYVYKNKYIDGGGHDIYYLTGATAWTYELSLKPLAFFRNTYSDSKKNEKVLKFLSNKLIVTFFYEQLNFQNTEFNGTPIRQMVSNGFMNKYSTDTRYGFKIGIGLY